MLVKKASLSLLFRLFLFLLLFSFWQTQEDLQADGEYETLCAGKDKPFVYRRGGLVLAVNPAGEALSADVDAGDRKPLFVIGSADVTEGRLVLGPQSFVVLK